MQQMHENASVNATNACKLTCEFNKAQENLTY